MAERKIRTIPQRFLQIAAFSAALPLAACGTQESAPKVETVDPIVTLAEPTGPVTHHLIANQAVEIPRDNQVHIIDKDGEFQDQNVGVSRLMVIADDKSHLLLLAFIIDGAKIDNFGVDKRSLRAHFLRPSPLKNLHLPMDKKAAPYFNGSSLNKIDHAAMSEGFRSFLTVWKATATPESTGGLLATLSYRKVSTGADSQVYNSIFKKEIRTI